MPKDKDKDNPQKKLRRLYDKMKSLPALPPARAAEYMEVDKRTVYRLLEQGKLEGVRRGACIWVTVRSIIKRMEEGYLSTKHFDLLNELE